MWFHDATALRDPARGVNYDLFVILDIFSRPIRRSASRTATGFKALKYCPAFPGRFGSLADARAFADTFFEHYNHHHRHSGIGYHAPASVHFGTAAEVRLQRAAVLGTAYAAHAERFVRRAPTPLPLPGPAWINRPMEEEDAQNIS